MSAHLQLVLLILLSQVSYIIGEFLFKHAMSDDNGWRKRLPTIAAGFGGVTLSFFLWLGLLDKADLSYLFPFQTLNVVVITLGAAIILKERLTAPLIAGMLLIGAGAALVFGS